MKMVLLLSTLCFALTFSLRTSAAKKNSLKSTLAQQLASLAYYPDVLDHTQGESLVVIRFRIDANDRLADLSIQSGENTQLNEKLVKQLTGKKMILNQPGLQQEYRARLHFRLV